MSQSIVESLHQQAAEIENDTEALLTRAIFLASVLKQKPVAHWLKCERDGYPADVPLPPYRSGDGATLIAHRPGSGWIEAPITDDLQRKVADYQLFAPLRELEKAYRDGRGKQGLHLTPDEERQLYLRRLTNLDAELALVVPVQGLARALGGARQAVLQWSAELSAAGIVGRGSAFEPTERTAASAITERLAELLKAASEAAETAPATGRARLGGLMGRLLGNQ